MMKVHMVQCDVGTLQVEANRREVERAMEGAEASGALLTVFPCCTLCGSPLYEAADYTDLQKRAQAALQELVALSDHRALLVGLPLQIQDRGLCNALVFVQNGAIRAVVTKKYLSVDEQRQFVRGDGVQVVDFHGGRMAIGFYEDLKELARGHVERADTVVCCGGQVFDYRRPYRLRYRMAKIVEATGASLVYVNRVGGEGPWIYGGGSMAMNAAGTLLCQLPYFDAAEAVVDLQQVEGVEDEKPDAVELVYRALVRGLHDYFAKNGLQRAVLGLSGGIDSALVATLAVDALGAENVHGLLMPSQYSSDHSVSDALALAANLGMATHTVAIAPMFEAMKQALAPVFDGRAEDVTEENLQARIRGTLVMSYANKFGALALNTTNRSEAAMGYGTLYGDSCGALAVIGDLYKTEVYQLSEWINRDGERIPQGSITKAPSAELRPGQKDSDSLPDYGLLDAILSLYLDEGLCEDEIVDEGYDRATVHQVIVRVARNEWKRLQFAPQLKVSPVSFGLDRRWPIS
jgi:NAD+ synthase (glutamine-hydrolysing)